jgi:hypothetical protein
MAAVSYGFVGSNSTWTASPTLTLAAAAFLAKTPARLKYFVTLIDEDDGGGGADDEIII